MLSYRHAYHAGNFADVLKHTVLSLLVDALNRKDKPWFYLDTHAGAGRYNLEAAPARRGAEHGEGIARLWGRPGLPRTLKPYLEAVAAVNGAPPPAMLRHYPGSPAVVRHFLRAQDRMTLAELHPQEIENLRAACAGDRRIAIEHADGYSLLKAQLPPRERRGLVLIDPAYERPDEWERVVEALRGAWERWPTGMYALWYPLLERARATRLERALKDAGIRKMLGAELRALPDDNPLRLDGSGMIIVNPPWHLDETLGELLPALWRALSPEGLGGQRVEWLASE